jgi:hypothetical protein
MTPHAKRAAAYVANSVQMHWHDKAVWHVRE